MVDLPVGKNPPANTGDARDASSNPGSGRSLEEEMAIHSCILAWKIPWREDPGGLQSVGFAELDTTEYASHLPWWVGGGGHRSGRRFRRALSSPFAAPSAGSSWLPAAGALSALSLSQPPANAWPAPLGPCWSVPRLRAASG